METEPGSVILGLAVLPFHAIEAVVFDPRHNLAETVISLGIGGPRRRRQRSVCRIDGQFRRQDKKRCQRSLLRAELLCEIQMQDARIKCRQQQRSVKHEEMKVAFLDQFLCKQDERRRNAESRHQIAPPYTVPLRKDAEAHAEHQKNIDKGLSCRQRVRIMKSVPNKIQNIDGKSRQEEEAHGYIDRFFPDADPVVSDIEHEKEIYRAAAVDIRPVVQALLRRHPAHMPCQHADDREVLAEYFRESIVRGSSRRKRTDLRKQQHH